MASYLGGENLAGHYLRDKINRYKPPNLSIINLRTPVAPLGRQPQRGSQITRRADDENDNPAWQFSGH